MPNSENLVPLNSRTTSEQREIAKKGGFASGESRREKGLIREALKAVLEGNFIVGKKTLNGYNAMAFSVVQKVISTGDVQAFKEIRDTIGEKPVNSVEIEVDDTKITKLTIEIADGNIDESEQPILGDEVPMEDVEVN